MICYGPNGKPPDLSWTVGPLCIRISRKAHLAVVKINLVFNGFVVEYKRGLRSLCFFLLFYFIVKTNLNIFKTK